MGSRHQAGGTMRRQEIAPQQAAAGRYDWAVPHGMLSSDDKNQAAILLTEKMVTALLHGEQTQDIRTSLFQKVDARCQPQSRQLGTAYALQSSTATVRVDEVKFGQQGTGGGRYVFDRRSYATAKRGPGKVAVQATVQVLLKLDALSWTTPRLYPTAACELAICYVRSTCQSDFAN